MSIKNWNAGIIRPVAVAPAGPYEGGAAPGMWTLDQAVYWKKQGLWPTAGTPPTIGQALGGGFFAGQIGVGGVATHNLVIGPLSSAQANKQYKNANTATAGADSDIDGPQNTADMVAGGSSTIYPAAHFCNDLVIGGFSDWYMPAKNEFEVCYYNLKPTTTDNSIVSGINPNAVPARASNYTAGIPTQTSAAAFQAGGSEALQVGTYWTSTEYDNAYARYQTTGSGFQSGRQKDDTYVVRAIRRVPV